MNREMMWVRSDEQVHPRGRILYCLDQALAFCRRQQRQLQTRLFFSTLALPLFLFGTIAMLSGLRGLLSGELPCGKRGHSAVGITMGVAVLAWVLAFTALRLGDAETHGVRLW